MKYCEDYVALLSGLLDGVLTPTETRQVQEHLAACPACRAYFADLQAIHQGFADLDEVEVPSGFTASVMAAVRADAAGAAPVSTPAAPTSGKRSVWKILTPVAACLALVVVLGATDLFPWNQPSASSPDSGAAQTADAALPFPAAEEAPADSEEESAALPESSSIVPREGAVASNRPAGKVGGTQVIESLPPVQSDYSAPEPFTAVPTEEHYFATLTLTQAEAGNLLAELQPATQTEALISYTLSHAEYDQLLLSLQEKGVAVPEVAPRISAALTVEPAEEGTPELALVTISLSAEE